MKKNSKMKKNVKESDALNLTVNSDDYDRNKDKLNNAVGDDGTITLANGNDGIGINDGVIKETLKLKISDIAKELGLNLFDKDPKVKAKAISIIRNMMSELQSIGVGSGIQLAEEDEFRDDDLFTKQDSDTIEQDVKPEKEFDSLMEALEKKGLKVVNIKETINPKMTKNDLIKYIKTKK